MRLNPPSENAEEDPGQFWKDFIRETAPVFRKPTIEQLEGFIGPTFEALCDGARYVDERLVEIIGEVEPDVIVEDNVVSFPALPASGRPWVRIVSCNPAEIKDPDVPPAFSGYPVADRGGVGRLPGRVRARARAAADVIQRVLRRARRAAAARARVHPHLARPQPVALSERGRLRPRASRSADGWRNLESCVRATDDAWELPEAAGVRRRPARLPQPRLARLRRRRADADPDRDPRRLALPRDRLDGPAARPARAGAEHDRRRVPAPDLDPAAGRPGDHPRRQQHGHRVPALRQADGRPAAVLGPVRQRPADRRDRASASGCRPTPTSPTSCARRSTGCSPTRRSPRTSTRSRAGSRDQPGTERAADLLERVANG